MQVDVADIGMNNAAEVVAAGLAAIEGGDAEFDLSRVKSCDSSAVAVALAWLRAAQARGLSLRLTGLPPGLVSLATVYGVAPLLELDAPADR